MPGSFSSSSMPAPYLARSSSRWGNVPVCGNGLQVGCHAFADAVDLQQARGISGGLGQVHRGLFGGFGGAAIAANAKAVGPV